MVRVSLDASSDGTNSDEHRLASSPQAARHGDRPRFTPTYLAGRKPQGWEGEGFDTETYKGWARLLCTSDSHIIVGRGDHWKAFDFLLANGPRLVAWNLRFDAEAVLKHLGTEVLKRLLAEEHVNAGAYQVDIVPWKMLRIRRGDEQVEVYDAAPFFGSRLETAAQRFLGEGKASDVDAKRLNEDSAYWERNLSKIVRYCKRDARLTRDLTKMISERFVKLGGDFRKPYSVAFVAADILMRDTSIARLPSQIVGPAEEAFVGARFECIARGTFKDVASYDIKSAYPAHLLKVEDASGRWTHGRRPHKDALHAIVRVRAHIMSDDYPIMAPLPVERGGVMVYPTGVFETVVLLDTWRHFEPHLEALESWSFIPRGEIVRPYEKTVAKLLAFREESDQLLKDAAKRGNNSIYGKLLNQRVERKLVPAASADHFTSPTVIIDGEAYKLERVRKQGLLYHPLHAGLITESCRLTIWEKTRKCEDRVLMIQADGIITRGAPLGKEKARVAGDLGYVARGRGVICGSGLYEIEGYARKTRGVMLGGADNEDKGGEKKDLPGRSWWTILGEAEPGMETVTFIDTRPAHLSECLRGGSYVTPANEIRRLGLKDANVFLPFPRNLTVTRDTKRIWPKIPDARALLTRSYRSKPLHLSEDP